MEPHFVVSVGVGLKGKTSVKLLNIEIQEVDSLHGQGVRPLVVLMPRTGYN
jgi:hypothetical protein